MNDKLKREYKKLKLDSKPKMVKITANMSNMEGLPDRAAQLLSQGESFICLCQSDISDNLFYSLAAKLSQLCAVFEATFFVEGDLSVCYSINPDGVILDKNSLDIGLAKEFLSEDILIGYSCETKESIEKSLKKGVDCIIIPTPSIATDNVVIEYAKWVYENNETPVFVVLDAFCAKNIAKTHGSNPDDITIFGNLLR